MHEYVGKNVLITTQSWFLAPNGQTYRAVWGTLKSINEAGKTLGFIPNRSHANWFIGIGKMTIMGCQVMYIIQCDDKPNTGEHLSWHSDAANGLKTFQEPSHIYISE